MLRSPPNLRTHRPWDKTATGAAPVTPSGSMNHRPSAGCTPRTDDERGCRACDLEPLGDPAAGERAAARVVDRHVFERARVVGEVEIELPGHRVHTGSDVPCRYSIVERDQPIGLRIGQRVHDDAVHHGEDRCVGGNRKGQRERCREREQRRSHEPPRRLPDLLRRHIHDSCLRSLKASVVVDDAFLPLRRIVRRRRAASRPASSRAHTCATDASATSSRLGKATREHVFHRRAVLPPQCLGRQAQQPAVHPHV